MIPSLTAKFERTAIQRSAQRLKSKGFKPFFTPVHYGAVQ